MTQDSIMALVPGTEMNVRVAQAVFPDESLVVCPPYSTDMNEAMRVLKQFLPDVVVNYLNHDRYPTGWHCGIRISADKVHHSHGCKTPAEAICKAALLVKVQP